MPDSQTIFVAVGATGFLILLLSVLLGEVGGHAGEFGDHGSEFGYHAAELGDHGAELGDHGAELGDHGAELASHGGEAPAPGGEFSSSSPDTGGSAAPGDGQADSPGGGLGDTSGHGDTSGNVSAPGAPATGIPEGSADLDAPTWRSIRVLAVALVGFGAAGFIAASSGVPVLLSWPGAAAGFLAVGGSAYRFILRPLAAQQYNSLTSRYGWLGRPAVVTLDILPHGTGQVTFLDRQGARITQTASSDLSEGVPKGSAVTITDLTKGGVVVHRSAFSD